MTNPNTIAQPKPKHESRSVMKTNTIIIALLLASTTGCGTVLNGGNASVTIPQGAKLNGTPGQLHSVSKERDHVVVYEDGRECKVSSGISGWYVAADIIFWNIGGLLIDALTSDWKTLDADNCPGVNVD